MYMLMSKEHTIKTARHCYRLELVIIHQRGIFFSLPPFHSFSPEPDDKGRYFEFGLEYAEIQNIS